MPVAACKNCGTVLVGRWCHACGQDAREPLVSLTRFVAEWADGVLAWDSRLLRTLRALLVDPGALSCRYWAGQRADRVSPVRLYLAVSFVFFLLLAFIFEPLQALAVASGAPDTDVAVSAQMTKDLPLIMFLLVPWLAAMLMLMFRAAGRLYLEHLVVALDYQSAAFVVQGVALLASAGLLPLGASLLVLGVASTLVQLASAYYYFRSLLSAYGLGPLATAWRAVAAFAGYIAVTLCVFYAWYGPEVVRLG
jgi:hypothetical protein